MHNPDTDDQLSPEHQRLIVERLNRHIDETERGSESLIECFDRVLLDHEKLHHGADAVS